MAEQETYAEKTSHETAIALIRKDIEFISQSIGKIETAIIMMDRNYTKRDEFNSVVVLVKDINTKLESKADHEDVKNIIKALDNKVDIKEFRPMNEGLKKLNMVVISAVVVGLLSIIIKN